MINFLFSFLGCLAFTSSPSAFASIKVAVTVDDLPAHGAVQPPLTRSLYFEQMLAAFKKHQVPSVYGFINGTSIEKDPSLEELLQKWVQEGHLLGNHTYSHPNLAKTSAADYTADILKNEPILSRIMSDREFRIFRYPFLIEGESLQKRNQVKDFLGRHQYKVAQVTVDFEDWAWNDPYTRCVASKDKKAARRLEDSYIDFAVEKLQRAEQLSQIVFKRKIPHILLVHIGSMNAKAMDRLLIEYKKAGVQFIPLSQAMKDTAYEIDPAWLSGSGENYLDQLMQSKRLKYPSGGRRVPIQEIQSECR